MAKRRRGRELSYYSWKRESKMSAAKERLSTQEWISPVPAKKKRSTRRFLRNMAIFVLLLAVICGIVALVLGWPGMNGIF